MMCPCCRTEAQAPIVERFRDPIQGKDYVLSSCSSCGVVFSQPRDPVGPDWYDQAPIGKEEACRDDWRYRTFFGEHIVPGRLLDAGCGAGAFLLAARKRGFEVSGFDFNPNYINDLKALGISDVWALDYKSFFSRNAATYDAVTLFDVLEHVPEPAELLAQAAKALRDGGLLAVTLPNGERPLPGPRFREDWDYPPFHFTRWTQEGLRRALNQAGFSVERCECSPLPFGFFSALFYYRLLKIAFPWLKRLLVGPQSADKTWTALLAADEPGKAAGVFKRKLSDPALRQRLTNAGFKLLFLIMAPLESPYILWLRKYRPEHGKTIYALARRLPSA